MEEASLEELRQFLGVKADIHSMLDDSLRAQSDLLQTTARRADDLRLQLAAAVGKLPGASAPSPPTTTSLALVAQLRQLRQLAGAGPRQKSEAAQGAAATAAPGAQGAAGTPSVAPLGAFAASVAVPATASKGRGKAAFSPPEAGTEASDAAVTLHIYDVSGDPRVTGFNNFARQMGTGAFHAGVEIYKSEWSFGYSSNGTGVFHYSPRQCSAHVYRESIHMGTTKLTQEAVDLLVQSLSAEWRGSTYDLLLRNCCHFSSALCEKLGVGCAPGWVTHLAGTSAALLKAVVAAKEQRDRLLVAAMGEADRLNEEYNLVDRIESLSKQEIQFDETAVESKVMDWWNSAMDSVEKVIEAAQKPVDVSSVIEPVETTAMDYWTTAVQQFSGLWVGRPAAGETNPPRPIAVSGGQRQGARQIVNFNEGPGSDSDSDDACAVTDDAHATGLIDSPNASAIADGPDAAFSGVACNANSVAARPSSADDIGITDIKILGHDSPATDNDKADKADCLHRRHRSAKNDLADCPVLAKDAKEVACFVNDEKVACLEGPFHATQDVVDDSGGGSKVASAKDCQDNQDMDACQEGPIHLTEVGI